ncbi:hypothetical protein RHGRI_036275 [Rhododendron griersonianum]|uniref:DUF674 family protein n=1 Tax=Rhododendron griersonianum TaxID=479676 RepID=A0AAV6HMY0_9ERIC|nr:hypothetical protein RHGRI_036275 [Rhododendron griersonianum]
MYGGHHTPGDHKVISLKLLVDKARDRVIFAESDCEFVDTLLSFLTLPIGSAVRLLGPDSTSIGSLTAMYKSVASLEPRSLRTDYCQEMLLNPRNATEIQCSKLKINVYPLEPVNLYSCDRHWCIDSGRRFSTVKGRPCRCKHPMSDRVYVDQAEKGAKDDCEGGGVFVKDGAFRFMITDDLQVMAGSAAACLSLFRKIGLDDGNEVEERTLEFGEQEVLCLLKFALLSKSPLTEAIRYIQCSSKKESTKFQPKRTPQLDKSARTANTDNMNLKLFVSKSKKCVLFAEAGADVVDFLFSILTYPLGSIIKLLGKNSGFGCMDNLYKSVEHLGTGGYLKSEERMKMLVCPKLAPFHSVDNQLLQIEESCLSAVVMDPKSPTGEVDAGKGYMKRPGTFMILNDLSVAPFSPVTSVALLYQMNIPVDDVVERVVAIGPDEALNLLNASLISKTVLSDVFNQREPYPEYFSRALGHQYGLVNQKQDSSLSQVFPSPPFLSLLHDPSSPEFLSLTCRSMSGGDDTPADRKVISLKLLVDKSRNRVIFAESDHDFVDTLLSFLTLPIGSVVRLLGPDSTAIGSLTTMYNSVASLESRHLRTDSCKDMLLNPRNATETQCSELKINVEPLEPVKLYQCNNGCCMRWFSTIKDRPCRCKNPTFFRVRVGQAEKGAKDDCEGGGVFVNDGAFRFMITDDLQVMAGSTAACLLLFQKLGIDDGNEVEERTLEFGEQEVLCLLKFALLSKSPLTEAILYIQCSSEKEIIKFQPKRTPQPDKNAGDANTNNMTLKLFASKSKEKVLYAEAGVDVVDFLFSILTYPLGSIIKLLGKNSGFGCMDNLYKTVEDLGTGGYLKSEERRKMLLCPKLAPFHSVGNQLLQIEEASYPLYVYDHRRNLWVAAESEENRHSAVVMDPKSPTGEVDAGKGYIKGPGTFMILNDLSVAPLSPVTSVALLNQMNVPINDVVERVVTIGPNEVPKNCSSGCILVSYGNEGLSAFELAALNLLNASLISKTVLSDVFNQREPYPECEFGIQHCTTDSKPLVKQQCWIRVTMLVCTNYQLLRFIYNWIKPELE